MPDHTCMKTIDAYTKFEEWLSNQPYWLQDAAFRIYHGLEIDEAQVSIYADMCISQAKKETVFFKHLAKNESRVKPVSTRMAVLGLSEINGVNDLSPNASLDFLPEGITVVYGLNGAGKSGFMRIFKQLSGSPFEEDIQPNVFKKGMITKPSCKVVVVEDDQQRDYSCSLSSASKESPLVNCDVFDTRISNDYISKDNNVSYQPVVFSVLTKLASTAGRIKRIIDQRIEAIPSREIKIPSDISQRDEIAWIRQINASATFPAQYSVWTHEQQKAFDEVTKRLDTEKVTSALRICEHQLNAICPVLDDLIEADLAINSSELQSAYKTFLTAKRRLHAAEKLFAETADDYDKTSIEVSDWKELWRIAQKYYESTMTPHEGKHFGEDGSICPLCHQVVAGNTSARIRSVNEYVNGTCSDDFYKAEDNLRLLLKAVTARLYSVNQIRNQLTNSIDDAELPIIESVYLSIGTNKLIEDVETELSRISKIQVSDATNLLSMRKVDLERKKKELELALEDEGHAALQKQLADLTCYKWIYDNKMIIEATITDLKTRQALQNARQYLTTNKITNEANDLANDLITEAYINRFTNELKRLAPNIKVKLQKAPSQKGSTPYRVTIDTDSGIKCKPEDILSEGEQRIVALAAFFADATGREAYAPIIIDDPISSLDINYETAATQRIVELALSRQVIVFTHRISMMTGIEETCQRFGVKHKETYIRSTNKGKGVLDPAEIYRGSVKSHLKGIQARLSEIKKMDPDSSEYDDAVGRQCQQFRICVERSVEDVLLLGMVHRFERRIITKDKVVKLTKITEDDCRMIEDMMTKYSFTEHSQPIDSPSTDIGIDELNNDVTSFISWIGEYQKR